VAREIIWTESAWTDLEEIAAYITKDSEYYAAALVREIRDASRTLGTLARRGRIVPEFHDPLIRELLVGNYRLIYRSGPGRTAVYILGVIHGARDLDALWKRSRKSKP